MKKDWRYSTSLLFLPVEPSRLKW